MNVSVPESAAADVRASVIPVANVLIDAWANALETHYGDVGGAFVTEVAIEYGHPYRGRPPRTVPDGLPNDPSIARRAEIQQEAEEERAHREREARIIASVQGAVDGHIDAEGVLSFARNEQGTVEGVLVADDYYGDLHALFVGLSQSTAAPTIKSLELGVWGGRGYQEAIDALADYPLPAVERLTIGSDERPQERYVQISWIRVGDLGGLYAAMPKLKVLRVRGCEIELGTLKHPRLEELRIESGDLWAEAIEAIAFMDCPKMRRLEVYFGDTDAGAEGTPELTAPLLRRKDLRELRFLELVRASPHSRRHSRRLRRLFRTTQTWMTSDPTV